jgi:hypothetical protein
VVMYPSHLGSMDKRMRMKFARSPIQFSERVESYIEVMRSPIVS